MESQKTFLNEKMKQTFLRRGIEYTRKCYNIEVAEAEKFAQNCQWFGATKSQMIRVLIKCFNATSG